MRIHRQGSGWIIRGLGQDSEQTNQRCENHVGVEDAGYLALSVNALSYQGNCCLWTVSQKKPWFVIFTFWLEHLSVVFLKTNT